MFKKLEGLLWYDFNKVFRLAYEMNLKADYQAKKIHEASQDIRKDIIRIV
jgi:hypothetical protein